MQEPTNDQGSWRLSRWHVAWLLSLTFLNFALNLISALLTVAMSKYLDLRFAGIGTLADTVYRLLYS